MVGGEGGRKEQERRGGGSDGGRREEGGDGEHRRRSRTAPAIGQRQCGNGRHELHSVAQIFQAFGLCHPPRPLGPVPRVAGGAPCGGGWRTLMGRQEPVAATKSASKNDSCFIGCTKPRQITLPGI